MRQVAGRAKIAQHQARKDIPRRRSPGERARDSIFHAMVDAVNVFVLLEAQREAREAGRSSGVHLQAHLQPEGRIVG